MESFVWMRCGYTPGTKKMFIAVRKLCLIFLFHFFVNFLIFFHLYVLHTVPCFLCDPPATQKRKFKIHQEIWSKHLGRKRIMMSPSPVAAAAPAEPSAQAPAPIIGESPTRLQNTECEAVCNTEHQKHQAHNIYRLSV